MEIRRAEDIAPAFDGVKGRADALYVVSEALVTANVVLITKLALDAGLPAISSNPEFAVSGGLIAYGANVPALFQRAADVVDKILHGAKPADIPVQRPKADISQIEFGGMIVRRAVAGGTGFLAGLGRRIWPTSGSGRRFGCCTQWLRAAGCPAADV